MTNPLNSPKRELRPEGNGPKSMLEEVYGVERRVDRPRKKVKMDGSEESQTTGSSGKYAHRSTGIVGDYMKPNPDTASPASQLDNLIDLTNSKWGGISVCYVLTGPSRR